MIPDVSKALRWLEENPNSLKGICRGIERETLRVTTEGHLASTGHPHVLGSALTHPWITTDFAEAMLEFITPVNESLDETMAFLHDIHRYVARHLRDERMWPLSIPCFIADEDDIELAQYGSSNQGRLKTVYREGLKNRYGALMQTISGVHYNFSLSSVFWSLFSDQKAGQPVDKEHISTGYFRLIRNYYRFGWVIPYLFGASPGVCASFIKGRKSNLPFERTPNGLCYLPYSTSLRLSDLGYTSKAQSALDITFNTLQTYVAGLRKATHTLSKDFQKIGIKDGETYLQLNANILQIENEFYAPIRPKRVVQFGESPANALLRGGVEYIEVRALDINPFMETGISEEQIRFLDVFLIWCALAEAPQMSSEELHCARNNWSKVILQGRKPGLMLGKGCGETEYPLSDIGHLLLQDLIQVADVLDSQGTGFHYRKVCKKLDKAFSEPDLTLSAQTLAAMLRQGIQGFGLGLAEKYHRKLRVEPLDVLSEQDFQHTSKKSWREQQQLEQQDTQSFDDYLASRIQ